MTILAIRTNYKIGELIRDGVYTGIAANDDYHFFNDDYHSIVNKGRINP